jgi:hypothetical protein
MLRSQYSDAFLIQNLESGKFKAALYTNAEFDKSIGSLINARQTTLNVLQWWELLKISENITWLFYANYTLCDVYQATY